MQDCHNYIQLKLLLQGLHFRFVFLEMVYFFLSTLISIFYLIQMSIFGFRFPVYVRFSHNNILEWSGGSFTAVNIFIIDLYLDLLSDLNTLILKCSKLRAKFSNQFYLFRIVCKISQYTLYNLCFEIFQLNFPTLLSCKHIITTSV